MPQRSLHRLLMRGAGLCLVLVFAATAAAVGPANDNLTNAPSLTGETNFVTGSNAGATLQAGEPDHGGVGGRSVWWSWTSPFTGSASIATAGSAFDTLLAVYTGNSISNLQLIVNNDDEEGFGIVTSFLVFRAIAGETYQIAVDGFEGASGIVKLAIGHTGYQTPPWSIVDVNGQLITWTNFHNHVLIVDFWETTCGACVDEIPYLRALSTNYAPAGFTFLGISKDPKDVDIGTFATNHGMTYPIARATLSTDQAFGTDLSFPTKFVVDRENKVVLRYSVGGVDDSYHARLIKPLLRGSNKVPLTVRRTNDSVLCAWPAAEFGYQLESNGTLGTTNWILSTAPIMTKNEENTVIVPADTGAKFFRLRKVPLP
jgi:thiol-disulfide isomerase/thioredoxin